MLLERLHGRTVNKVICTRDFHDVHYIYAMLYSIFTALDRAQGALGESSRQRQRGVVLFAHWPGTRMSALWQGLLRWHARKHRRLKSGTAALTLLAPSQAFTTLTCGWPM